MFLNPTGFRLFGRYPVTSRAYADQIELVATFAPNQQQFPGLTTTFTEKA
jgi:hypothetical protein